MVNIHGDAMLVFDTLSKVGMDLYREELNAQEGIDIIPSLIFMLGSHLTT